MGKWSPRPTTLQGVARMAVLQDPQGAMFAVSAQVERTRYKNPQLGEFSWHELLTTNMADRVGVLRQALRVDEKAGDGYGGGRAPIRCSGTGGLSSAECSTRGGFPPGGRIVGAVHPCA